MLERTTGGWRQWTRRTLHELDHHESFLEEAITASPSFLGLDDELNSGANWRAFPQVSLNTATGRRVRPDILFISRWGELIVVEVKLYTNPELRSRAPVAQMLDYAAALATPQPEELLRALGGGTGWGSFFESQFPDLPNPADTAVKFLAKVQAGDVHLVLAGDRLPAGVYDWLEQVSAQSALPFQLRVVEVIPYTPDGATLPVVLVPALRAKTKIVARTVVEVRKPDGDLPVKVVVGTPSAQEVERNIRQAKQPRASSRNRQTVKEAISLLEPKVADLVAPAGRFPLRGGKKFWVHASRCIVSELYREDAGDIALDIFFDGLKKTGDPVIARFVSRPADPTSDRLRFATDAEAKVLRALRTEFPSVSVDRRGASPYWPGTNPHWRIEVPDEALRDGWTPALIADVAEKVIRAVADTIEFQSA